MDYRLANMSVYYRKKTYDGFVRELKCSISMTSQMDISQLREWCRERNEKINVAILYLVSRAIHQRPSRLPDVPRLQEG